ncbi:MAG TPA: hypothetical protein VMA96_04550 [Solirubrobacteraceae bacterium]|nr:hypothetical protein [Solirubrobacteraceae bacterium]
MSLGPPYGLTYRAGTPDHIVTDGDPARLLVVLPVLFGDGMRLTESLSLDAGPTFERERTLPGGSVEIVSTR